MNKETLAELGLTETDVLNKLVERLLDQYAGGEDYKSDFERRVEAAVKEQIDAKLDAALDVHILPKVAEMIDGICLTETNKWGEPKGPKLTFIEYLTQRADAYIREEVNYKGQTKDQDSYSWSKHSTRIAFMINTHLQYSINQAMLKAFGEVDSSVRKGLEEAVKFAIAGIKVTVDTKVKSP